MNIPSCKKAIIRSLACVSLTESGRDEDVILLTAAGLLSGHVPKEGSDPMDYAELLHKLSEQYKKDQAIDPDARLPGDDGYFVLSDARLINGANTLSLGNFVVFYDQIIGITYGKIFDQPHVPV